MPAREKAAEPDKTLTADISIENILHTYDKSMKDDSEEWRRLWQVIGLYMLCALANEDDDNLFPDTFFKLSFFERRPRMRCFLFDSLDWGMMGPLWEKWKEYTSCDFENLLLDEIAFAYEKGNSFGMPRLERILRKALRAIETHKEHKKEQKRKKAENEWQ